MRTTTLSIAGVLSLWLVAAGATAADGPGNTPSESAPAKTKLERPGWRPGPSAKPPGSAHSGGVGAAGAQAKPKKPSDPPPVQGVEPASPGGQLGSEHDQGQRRRQAGVGLRPSSPPAPDDPALRPDERRAKRELRRREVAAALGEKAARHPNVQTELRHHAWRLARLNRMLELANQRKEPKLVARIEKLRAVELTRHRNRLESLRQHPELGQASVGTAAPLDSSNPGLPPSTSATVEVSPAASTGGVR